MEISYANRHIQKICTSKKTMQKELGTVGAKILQNRLEQAERAENLEALRFEPGHWHELTGDRWGQTASCILGRI